MRPSCTRLLFAAASTAVFLCACAGCTLTTEGLKAERALALEDIFPPPRAAASYAPLGKPRELKDEDLAALLGGARRAAVLKDWGFVSASVCDYGLPPVPEQSEAPGVAKAQVGVVQMVSAFQAYGAYSNLRPGLLPEKDYLKLGVDGALLPDLTPGSGGPRLLFVLDRYLVAVRALGPMADEPRRALLFTFGLAIQSRIPKSLHEPYPLAYLPVEWRVPGSERLNREDVLGLGLFPSGSLSAVYRRYAKECVIQIAADDERRGWRAPSLKRIGSRLLEAGPVKELFVGEELWDLDHDGLYDRGYHGRLAGKTCMVALRLGVVFCAYGDWDEKEMRSLLAAIDRNLHPFAPPLPPPKEEKSEKPPAAF